MLCFGYMLLNNNTFLDCLSSFVYKTLLSTTFSFKPLQINPNNSKKCRRKSKNLSKIISPTSKNQTQNSISLSLLKFLSPHPKIVFSLVVSIPKRCRLLRYETKRTIPPLSPMSTDSSLKISNPFTIQTTTTSFDTKTTTHHQVSFYLNRPGYSIHHQIFVGPTDSS